MNSTVPEKIEISDLGVVEIKLTITNKEDTVLHDLEGTKTLGGGHTPEVGEHITLSCLDLYIAAVEEKPIADSDTDHSKDGCLLDEIALIN